MFIQVVARLFRKGATQLNQNDRQQHCGDVFHGEIAQNRIFHRSAHVGKCRFGVATGAKILDQAQQQLRVCRNQQDQGRSIVFFQKRFFAQPAAQRAIEHKKTLLLKRDTDCNCAEY